MDNLPEYYDRFELDSLRGVPTGPLKYVEVLEMEVPTYLEKREDLYGQGIQSTLMHHVPLRFRGPYKVRATDPTGPNGESKNHANYCMCMGVGREASSNGTANPRPNQKSANAGKPCKNKAINYSGFCVWHGGALHPLDKSDPKNVPREMLFKMGKLDYSTLDDEELSRGQIRREDGTWTNFKTIPIAVHDAMIKKLFDRAEEKLRAALVDTVDTMVEISKSTAVEPADRIRAATWIYERVRGKTPDTLIVTQDKPFEIVMGAVLEGGSRAASRARRGIVDDEMLEIENAVEAELVDLEDEGIETYETTGLRDDPELRLAETEGDTRFVQSHVDPVHGPEVGYSGIPQDPDLLNKQLREQRLADEAAKQRIKDARAKRFAARSKGLNHVESYPYSIEVEDSPEDGPTHTKVFWIEPVAPKMPREAEAAETRRRNKERWR